MTRINCIPTTELSREHLVAEYRELPRLFALVRAAQTRGERPDDRRNPSRYLLGAGHVRFFYPRLAWVLARQIALIAEMQARGYQPNFTNPQALAEGIGSQWFGDWTPDEEALALNRARIAERLGAKPAAAG